jgi:hypothetical protein
LANRLDRYAGDAWKVERLPLGAGAGRNDRGERERKDGD